MKGTYFIKLCDVILLYISATLNQNFNDRSIRKYMWELEKVLFLSIAIKLSISYMCHYPKLFCTLHWD